MTWVQLRYVPINIGCLESVNTRSPSAFCWYNITILGPFVWGFCAEKAKTFQPIFRTSR